jgi:hypothetical protein
MLSVKRKLGAVGVGVGDVGPVDEWEQDRTARRLKSLAHVDEMVYKAGGLLGKRGSGCVWCRSWESTMAGCPQESSFNRWARVDEILDFERVVGSCPHLLIKL